MKRISRRELLKTVPLGGLALLLDGSGPLRQARQIMAAATPEPAAESFDPLSDEGARRRGGHDRLHKIRDFDRTYDDDYLLGESRLQLLRTTAARLERAVQVIGHGHFNLVSFDDLLRYAERYEQIGVFTPAELEFLEEIFYTDAELYGFFGRKVLHEMTARFAERDVERIASTGHYLLHGEPLERYERIRKDLGPNVFLTSGVRGVVKQFQLFLSKAVTTGGNLSQASRSLAPPGYSYHAVGDFDIGRVGFGLKNFTADFAETPEYRKLIDLGYVDIRYTETNHFGVRHEPWHIKIA
jgi:hypothetical protein